MTIQFLGASRTVTGSSYLIKTDSAKILVDCGMFQGDRELEDRNYAPFSFNPEEINFLILTHAHLDHCGLIPRLVKEGFRGKIYSTAATRDIYEINAYDAAKIQKEDNWETNKRILYTSADVLKSLSLFHVVDYGEETRLMPNIFLELHDAGHILGSSFVTLNIDNKKITFSGDLGHEGQLIVRKLAHLSLTDYLIMETTYADRNHKSREGSINELVEVINEAYSRGGNILVPSFAVERTQELIFTLKLLTESKRIPKIPIYIDSPLAIKATQIFTEHYDNFNIDALTIINEGGYPFKFENLHYIENFNKSRKLAKRNSQKIVKSGKGYMVIAGSGMCNGGRILKYLQYNLPLSRSTVIIVGYQAQGTLGRALINGVKNVNINGKYYNVRAKITTINGFSAHADKDDLIAWITNTGVKPKGVFLVHGEEDVSLGFADLLKNTFGINAIVPEWKDTVTIE